MNITRIVYDIDRIGQTVGYDVDLWKYATAEYDGIIDLMKQQYTINRFLRQTTNVNGNDAWLYDIGYEDSVNGRMISVNSYGVLVRKGIEIWMISIEFFNEESKELAIDILSTMKIE